MTVEDALKNVKYCECEITNDSFTCCLKHETIPIICKALEKQIPKEPYRISEIDSNDNAIVDCPICIAGNETSIKTIKRIYCWKCGQAIKWE